MKKRMTKLVALSMTALMAATLAACGSDGGNSGGSESKTSGEDTTAKKESGDDSKEIIYWNIGTESPDKDVIAKAVDKLICPESLTGGIRERISENPQTPQAWDCICADSFALKWV